MFQHSALRRSFQPLRCSLVATLTLAFGLVSLSVAWPVAGRAQELGLTAIRAGRLLDTESGEVRRNQVLVVQGERIVRIVSDVPGDAGRVIDLSEYFVVPGLMDAHVHLTGDQRYHGYSALQLSTPRQALIGARSARQVLEAGFTFVRNVGAGGYADVALRDGIAAGDVPGPRMLVAGPSLGITGGHCDNNLLPPEASTPAEGVADGPWGVRTKVRQNIKFGADLIKICATGGVLSKGTSVGAPQYSLEEMTAVVEEAHKRGRKVAAHAHGTEGIKLAIQAGVDSVEHASLIDEEGVRMAKERGTRLVMDIYVSDYILSEGEAAGILPESLEKERKVGGAQRESFGMAHRQGAQVVFGTDAGIFPHGDNGRQFAYMVRYGMTSLEAIQAATIRAAELFGVDKDAGALTVGRFADLVAVADDPLEDVSRLENFAVVIKGGVVVKDAR